MSNIYESDFFSRLQMGSMHPGGLRLTDRAVRLAGLRRGMRAADIGCGTGATAAFLTEKFNLNVIGLEISEKLIDIGQKNTPGLTLIQWDGASLPFEAHSLDAVFFECTLSVLADKRVLLAQASQALRTGGVAVISDVCSKRRDDSVKLSLFTSDALAETLTAAGFDVVIREDHTPALRTFAAELWEKAGGTETGYISCLFGAFCDMEGIRLSDLVYTLIIAKKTGE